MTSDHISKIMPEVLTGLPGPTNERSESPPSTSESISANSLTEKLTVKLPLATPWQRNLLKLENTSPAIQMMAHSVEAWCGNLARNSTTGRTIVITGPFGCGKTHALIAARRYVRAVRMDLWPVPWPFPPQYYACNWADFVREQVQNTNEEMREDLLDSHIIFIDDIGSEEDTFRSGAPTRILGDILGRLHDKKRFVFITTNIDQKHWAERWDGRVEDRLLRMDAAIVNLWRQDLQAESYAVWKLKNSYESNPEI